MNNQEAFNKSWAYFTNPHWVPAWDSYKEMCMYRCADGKACAIGNLISDDEYASDMEGHDVGSLLTEGLLPVSLRSCDKEFLADLQRLHDNEDLRTEDRFESAYAREQYIINALTRIANNYNLRVP